MLRVNKLLKITPTHRVQAWGSFLIKIETLAQVVSCKFCEISKNTSERFLPLSEQFIKNYILLYFLDGFGVYWLHLRYLRQFSGLSGLSKIKKISVSQTRWLPILQFLPISSPLKELPTAQFSFYYYLKRLLDNQANINLFKVYHMCIATSKLTIWRRSRVIIVKFEHISNLFLVFLLLNLSMYAGYASSSLLRLWNRDLHLLSFLL